MNNITVDGVPLKALIDALLGSKDWCAPSEDLLGVLRRTPEAARWVVINRTTFHHEPSAVSILWRKDSWEKSYMRHCEQKAESEARVDYWNAHKALLSTVMSRTHEASSNTMPDSVIEQMALGFIRAGNFEAIKIFNPTIEIADLYVALEAMNKLKTVKELKQ